MAKLVFGMNQSLDGYVDHMAFAPSPTLFRHFIEEAQRRAVCTVAPCMRSCVAGTTITWGARTRLRAAWRNSRKGRLALVEVGRPQCR